MSRFLEVNWSEGLFLRPHHLQQATRHQLGLLHEEISSVRPYAWGIHELEIAEAELENHSLTIRRCNARLKDGTRVVIPDNAEVEPRDFKDALDAADGSIAVYLGLPYLTEREPNTVMAYDESVMQNRRFVVASVEREDENTGSNAQAIEVRKLNPRIIFEGEDMTGYETLKLIQIVRSGIEENKPVISGGYIPALLDMAAWRPLFDEVSDFYQQLLAKNRSLAAQIVGRDVAFGSEGVGGPEAMLKLSITNRYTAFLKQYAATPRLHPFDVYVELCRLAGDLAIFDPERAVADIPLYDHDDVGRCFDALFGILEKLLNNLMPTTFIRRRFDAVENRLEVSLDDDWLHEGVQFYLGIESDAEPEHIDRHQAFLKMASPESLVQIKRNRLPALMGKRVARVPIGLPDKPNLHYYRIVRHENYWPAVAESKTLSCIDLQDQNLDLYLYVLLKSSDGGESR